MNTMSQCLCLVFVCFWTFWGTILALDVLPQKEKYLPDYNFYHNISQTEKDLKSIALLYPDFVRIEWMYRSRNDAPQLVTHITNFSLPFFDESPNEGLGYRKILSPKVLVLFSYGEHAREFFPVESCFHLLKNLTDGLKAKLGSYEETFTRSVLRRFDIYAIVMANPDGRSYIESSQNFCWRGTSRGVDLNRNFDWQFAKSGSSNDPEDEEYRGPLPFSEPECNVYIHLTSLMHFDAFISFHSGIRRIYMPFADTASKTMRRIPYNNHHMEMLSTRLSSVTQYRFKFGKAYDLNLYPADGTIFDYMAGVQQLSCGVMRSTQG
ncbi:carboxypeptidase A1-like isoform X4 [Pomacea canaliculata]|uniref:carboxypeptidase A1-like isoform X4 n=1 Tax=Pomacea canaliculata TaxID=400727 RepID=UPI000D72F28C|nr:carboxypeptidase A1-like isoform X4 [Pomacea canaliculata]